MSEQRRELSDLLGSIEDCDKEQIHLSGAVQGRGCLIVFDSTDLRVQNVSDNTKGILDLDQNPLGARLNHIFDANFVNVIQECVRTHPWITTGRHLEYSAARAKYEGYLFESDGVFCLEMERLPEERAELEIRRVIDEQMQEFMEEFRNLSKTEDVAHLVCQKVRKITGLDRVMMYEFVKPQWHGQVIAEDRVIEAHSFLGHRFPSSDIPKPARDLYLRNRVRWISNIDKPISAIMPPENFLTGKKLDLSDSRLRSVSPIHLHYLKNMGVQSSMSFAVTVRGEMWGLVACHHMSDIEVTQEQRRACEFVVNAFAAQGPLLNSLALERAQTDFAVQLQKFFQTLVKSANPSEALVRHHTRLEQIFDISGVAYVSGQKIDVAGITPQREELKTLTSTLIEKLNETGEEVFVTTSLISDFKEALPAWGADPELQKMVCGVIAIRSPAIPDGLFMLFRPELIKTITWGGDPVKQLNKKNFPGPINPRVSFETWREVIRHGAKPWADHEVAGAHSLKDFVFDTLVPRMT